MMTYSGAGRQMTPLLRRARLAALAVGAFLLPWCVLLAATLPATARAQNWSLAWTGLDAGEAIAALSTAVLLARADIRAAVTAAAGGALLLADAWFDVCTSAPGLGHAEAMAEAVLVEVPLAVAAFWLAFRLTRAGGRGQVASRGQAVVASPAHPAASPEQPVVSPAHPVASPAQPAAACRRAA